MCPAWDFASVNFLTKISYAPGLAVFALRVSANKNNAPAFKPQRRQSSLPACGT